MNTSRELRRIYRSYRLSGSSVARSSAVIIWILVVLAISGCRTHGHDMGWSHSLAIIAFVIAAAIFLFTAIPQRKPGNRRVAGPPHPGCERRYVP